MLVILNLIHIFGTYDIPFIVVYFIIVHSKEAIDLPVKMPLSSLEINITLETHFLFEYFDDLLFYFRLLQLVLDVINFIIKILDVFSLLDISLLEYICSVLHFWQKNDNINNCK